MTKCNAIYGTNIVGGSDICSRPINHEGRHDWRGDRDGKCFGKDCTNEGTILDMESGPIRAMLCPSCYALIMKRRDENEASWNKMIYGHKS